MSPIEIAALLALVGYAVYRQTRRQQVDGAPQLVLPLAYAIAGVAIGGFALPRSGAEAVVLAIGLALGVAVGVARGHWTRMSIEDGRVYAQGTRLTVGLFLGLIAAKVAIGTACYFLRITDDGGFGETLVIIAIMVAFQAELVRRRARTMLARTVTPIAT